MIEVKLKRKSDSQIIQETLMRVILLELRVKKLEGEVE